MIELTKPQRGVVRVALLLAACLSSSEAVQVATPAQADLQVSENLGVDGASAFDGMSVNALYDTIGLKNEIIALRFDLTGRGRLQSTKAWLKLTNAKQNTTTQVLYFYGVTQGATGYNEVTSTPGTFTDNDWPENGTVFSTTPGLRFDADAVTTRGVDASLTTYLGGVAVDNGNRDEGAELILSTPELQDFLTNHPDDVVTILVMSNTDGTSQKRFATKEATNLDTNLTLVPAGTYAPRLVLDLPGTNVKASADAQVNEVIGSATTPTSNTGNGTGTSLNSRYTTAANGERNEVMALRFDLTNLAPGQITAADLRLVNHRDNTSNANRIHIYGVNDGAKGRNAIDTLDGPYTDNDWPESGTVFSQMPGLEYDNSVVVQNCVLLDRVTDLGSTYVSVGNRNNLKGVDLVFSNERLRNFLANHPDRIVTILLVADAPISNNQKRFASKEATGLDADPVDTVPAGTYAPSLNLMIDSFAITNITLGSGTGQITLTWESKPDQVFRITHSENLQDGFPGVSATDIPAAVGASTTHTFTNPIPAAPRLFFRVERP
jgi:hypothetical protein